MKNLKLFAVLALIACSPSKSERTKELSADDDTPGIAWSKDTVDALDILRQGIEEKVSVVEVESARFYLRDKNDTCIYAATIVRVLSEAMANHTKWIDTQELMSALRENASNVESRCYFPRNSEEAKLLYRFTDRMAAASIDSAEPIRIVLWLRHYLNDAVEYSEYLHSVIPRIALNNTEGFIREVNTFESSERLIILENLEYLPNIEAIQRLRTNLKNIKSKELHGVIAEAETAIEKIFER